MKGLVKPPGHRELLEAYERIQAGAGDPPSLVELGLWTQWARFDPRLAEQWIGLVQRAWRQIPVLDFNRELRAQPWPAAAGVLLDQAGAFRPRGTHAIERQLFRDWRRLAMSGIPPAEGGQFFIGLRSFAGNAMRLDAEDSLRSYRRWGFLGREILRTKAAAPGSATATLATRSFRRKRIGELIRTGRSFTVNDYLRAVGYSVSRRQAELDLREDSRIEAQGKTRALVYRARGRARAF